MGVGQIWKSVTSLVVPGKTSGDEKEIFEKKPNLNEAFDEFNFTVPPEDQERENDKSVEDPSEITMNEVKDADDFVVVEYKINDLEQEMQYNLAVNNSILANAESSSTEIVLELKFKERC